MASFDVDWTPLGKLGEIYRQSQDRQAVQQGLSQMGLPQNLTLANLALQQQAIQRQQANQDRSFGLQERQFGLQERSAAEAARGFEIREYEKPDGTKGLLRIEKLSGKATPLDPSGGGAPETPNNPYMTGGKMNESQSKDALYASRMMQSERVLRGIEADVVTNPIEKMRGWASDKTGYNIRSPEYQKFDQAQRDFINATLRRESGAVISPSEFDNANKQYFPQPGDTADVIKQKRANRAEAIRGIGAGAGSGYRPDHVFDAKGEIVDNPAPKRGEAKPPVQGARQAPDGNFYVPDPGRPGKYLKVNP